MKPHAYIHTEISDKELKEFFDHIENHGKKISLLVDPLLALEAVGYPEYEEFEKKIVEEVRERPSILLVQPRRARILKKWVDEIHRNQENGHPSLIITTKGDPSLEPDFGEEKNGYDHLAYLLQKRCEKVFLSGEYGDFMHRELLECLPDSFKTHAMRQQIKNKREEILASHSVHTVMNELTKRGEGRGFKVKLLEEKVYRPRRRLEKKVHKPHRR